jgi:hypothetical protein
MSAGDAPELSGRLLAFLDEGVAPVSAQEARARAGSRPNRRFSFHWNPRRNSLALAGAFALALVVGSIALVSVTRGHAVTATKPLGHQLFVARLVPEVNATSIQLDKASAVVLRRLHLLGQPDAHSSVSGDGIVITTSRDVSMVRSMLAGVLPPGNLLFRPVLCAAPAYNPARPTNTKNAPSPGVLPTSCPAANQLTGSNLNVNTDTGIPQTNISPWSALAGYPSTRAAQDIATRTVLLAAGTNSGFASGERLLLGPAYLSGLDVSSAQPALFSPNWVLDLTLDPAGSTAWDALTDREFHAYVGFDLDANLVSVPLTEPNQATFASFGGKVQISGGFTHATANDLAIDLESGPLPVPLRAGGSAGG